MINTDVVAVCRRCGQKFHLGTEIPVIYRQEYRDAHDAVIMLTYYDCPQCGTRHFVQADDATSVRMLNDVSKVFVKIAVAKSSGKCVPAKLQDKYTKCKSHLGMYRMKLMLDWNGRDVYRPGSPLKSKLEFSM